MLRAVGQWFARRKHLDLRSRVAWQGNSQWLGTDYGGHSVAVDQVPHRPRVYSFGIGEDISFDLAMIERFDAQVFAFDPTPKSLNWLKSQNLPDAFEYYGFGLGGHDGTAQFEPPSNPDHVSHRLAAAGTGIEFEVKTLRTILGQLGHDELDLLKLDIEGSEYAALDNILASELRIPQILVEFHHQFPGIGSKKTLDALDAMEGAGYQVSAVSPSSREVSFILT